jgi:hypothetical protein
MYLYRGYKAGTGLNTLTTISPVTRIRMMLVKRSAKKNDSFLMAALPRFKSSSDHMAFYPAF